MGRTILAVLVGLVVAGLSMTAIQMIGHALSPPPQGMYPQSAESVAEFMDQISVAAKLMVCLAWAVGSFLGAYAAGIISYVHKRGAALSVGVLMTLSIVANLTMIPHPLWMILVGLFAPLPLAFVAWKLIGNATVPAPDAQT